mmetsp:Transcript_22799/g.35103  ORF Transcript_22799/g.35103 Transcript_22799/m.35103 type:complete len:92 (+) Transcript_22799:120-395(+)
MLLTLTFVFLAVGPALFPHLKLGHIQFFKAIHHMLMNETLLYVALGTTIVSLIALTCCGFDQKVPTNYFLLGLFTAGQAWGVAAICHHTNP